MTDLLVTMEADAPVEVAPKRIKKRRKGGALVQTCRVRQENDIIGIAPVTTEYALNAPV